MFDISNLEVMNFRAKVGLELTIYTLGQDVRSIPILGSFVPTPAHEMCLGMHKKRNRVKAMGNQGRH